MLQQAMNEVAYKLFSRDEVTFKELIPQEHERWKKIQNQCHIQISEG
jgi:hypothetical protein